MALKLPSLSYMKGLYNALDESSLFGTLFFNALNIDSTPLSHSICILR